MQQSCRLHLTISVPFGWVDVTAISPTREMMATQSRKRRSYKQQLLAPSDCGLTIHDGRYYLTLFDQSELTLSAY